MAAGAPVAAFREVATASELARAVGDLGPPVIAKRVRFGYDGRGQVRLATGDAAAARGIVETLGDEGLVVEEVVPFDAEISVVVARGIDGEVAHHGVMENVHVNRILDTTVTPPVSVAPTVARAAVDLATTIARHLELVGVLCVEMFVTGEDLVVNEIAPRPHNSGHCTIEAASTSQFGQQMRAICGLPLGDGACRPAAMVQLLGDLWDDPSGRGPAWSAALADPGVHLHLYGKEEVRPGRKMGHITCTDITPERASAARPGGAPQAQAAAMIPVWDHDSPREECGVVGVVRMPRVGRRPGSRSSGCSPCNTGVRKQPGS